MFCKNCGTEIQENAKFCQTCGAKVELPASPEQVAETVPTPQNDIPVPKSEPPFFPEEEGTKKKSKKGLVFGIIGAVVAVLVALLFAYPYISSYIKDVFTPEEKLYESIEKNSAEQFVDGIGDVIDELKEKAQKMENTATDETYAALYAVVDALPSGDKTEEILTRYIDVIFEKIGDSKKEKDEITVLGDEIKVTKATVTLDESTLEKIAVALTQKAKDDKELYRVLKDVTAAVDPYSAEEIDTLYETLGEINIEEEYKGVFEGFEEIEISVLMDSKGNVIGREFVQNTSTLRFINFEKDGKVTLEILFESDGEKIEFSGNGKTEKDKFTGKFTFKTMDQPIFNVKFDDVKEEGGGKITLELSKEVLSMLPMVMDTDTFKEKGIDLSSLAVAFEISTKKDISTISISVLTGKDTFLSFDIQIDENGNIINSENFENGENDVINNLNETDLVELIDALPYEAKQFVYGMILGMGGSYYEDDYDYGYDYDYDYDYDYTDDYEDADDYDYYSPEVNTDEVFDDYENDAEYGYDVGGNGYNPQPEAAIGVPSSSATFRPSMM